MDDVKISKKIQALTLELQKKEKKLLRLNKRNELRKSLGKGTSSPLCLNGIATTTNSKETLSRSFYTPALHEKRGEIPAVNTSSANVSPSLHDLCSERTVKNHCKLFTLKLDTDDVSKSSVCDKLDLRKYDSPPNVTIISDKCDDIQNHEEELFPDVNEDTTDHGDVCMQSNSDEHSDDLIVKNCQNQLNEYNFEKENNCGFLDDNKLEENIINLVVPHPSEITDLGVNTFSNKQNDEMNLKRRSSRISSRTTRNRTPVNRFKFDIKSIIDVAFDVLCEMGRNTKQEDFTLSGKEFDDAKLKRLNSEVYLGKNTEDFICTENIVPPTLAHISCKIQDGHKNNNRTLLADVTQFVVDNSKVTSHFSSCLKTTSKAESTEVLENDNKEINLVHESVHIFDGHIPKEIIERNVIGTSEDGVENELGCKAFNNGKTAVDSSKKQDENFPVILKCETYNTKEIDLVCETVLTDIVNVLDVKEQNSDTTGERIQKETCLSSPARSSCQLVHCLQKQEEDPAEGLFFAEENNLYLAWLQRKKSISVWKKFEKTWSHLDTYRVAKACTEEILDATIFGLRLAVLYKEHNCSIRILSINHSGFCVQNHIALGLLSRAAVSGCLYPVQEDQAIASCLQFESQCPQIEIHAVGPSQSATTTYIEPANENMFGSVVWVHGLPSGLMGLGAQKLFFWNVSSGLLVRTVPLHSSEELGHTFEKCIWTNMEKGLLFGVFKDDKSDFWKLFVINPATGLYHELCHYACPTCADSKCDRNTNQRPLYGRVECHKLLSICTRCHMTVFDLLSAKALLASKAEDTGAASLHAMDLLVASLNGSVQMYTIVT